MSTCIISRRTADILASYFLQNAERYMSILWKSSHAKKKKKHSKGANTFSLHPSPSLKCVMSCAVNRMFVQVSQ